jgi:hypothetical protein
MSKKLTLAKETLRVLDDADLVRVVGGGGDDSEDSHHRHHHHHHRHHHHHHHDDWDWNDDWSDD